MKVNWKTILGWVLLAVLLVAPIGLGWLYNQFLIYNDVPNTFSLVVAAAFLVFWFWAGMCYGKRIKNPALAILLGNLSFLVSAGIYYWQYEFVTQELRNYPLANFSQLALTPVISLAAKFGVAVGKIIQPNAFFATQLVWDIIIGFGLALVLGFFCWGYFTLRKRTFGPLRAPKKKA